MELSPPGIHQFIDAGSHSRPRLEIVAAGAAKLATHSVPALSVSGVCFALRCTGGSSYDIVCSDERPMITDDINKKITLLLSLSSQRVCRVDCEGERGGASGASGRRSSAVKVRDENESSIAICERKNRCVWLTACWEGCMRLNFNNPRKRIADCGGGVTQRDGRVQASWWGRKKWDMGDGLRGDLNHDSAE